MKFKLSPMVEVCVTDENKTITLQINYSEMLNFLKGVYKSAISVPAHLQFA